MDNSGCFGTMGGGGLSPPSHPPPWLRAWEEADFGDTQRPDATELNQIVYFRNQSANITLQPLIGIHNNYDTKITINIRRFRNENN